MTEFRMPDQMEAEMTAEGNLDVPTPAVVVAEDEMFHIQSKSPTDMYLRDQMDPMRSVTDIHLVCQDGHIPVHRYILMGISGYLKDILQDLDPSELAVIHLPDIKLKHLVQIMSLLYTGKAIITKADQIPVFSLMNMLGISTQIFEFRTSKPTDHASIPRLRSYQNQVEQKDDDREQTYVYPTLNNDISRHSSTSNLRCPSSSTSSAISDFEKHRQESIGILRTPLSSSPNRRDKENAEGSLKKKGVPIPTEPKTYKCWPCDGKFDTMDLLLHHLTVSCAVILNSKYIYSERRCLICNTLFPSFNIWGLLRHVNCCTGKYRRPDTISICASPIRRTSNTNTPAPGPLPNNEPQSSDSNSITGEMDEEIGESKLEAATVEKRSNRIKEQMKKIKEAERESEESIIESLILEAETEMVKMESVDDLQADDDGATGNIAPSTSHMSTRAIVPRKKRRRRGVISKKLKRRKTLPPSQFTADSDGIEFENGTVDTAFDTQELPEDPAKIELGTIRIIGTESLAELVEESEIEIEHSEFFSEVAEPTIPTYSGTKKFKNIDSDIVRKEFGVQTEFDMPHLTTKELQIVFRRCPLCKIMYDKLKFVSKCLRMHGYRYCWSCLKLIQYKGRAFDEHCRATHCLRAFDDRVDCPLCDSELEFKHALPTHMGNYHAVEIDKMVAFGEKRENDRTLVQSECPNDDASISSIEQVDPLTLTETVDYVSFPPPQPQPRPILHIPSILRKSRLRDILTGPSTSSSAMSSTDRPNTRRRSSKGGRDARLIASTGENLIKHKKLKGRKKQKKGKANSSSVDSEANPLGITVTVLPPELRKPRQIDNSEAEACSFNANVEIEDGEYEELDTKYPPIESTSNNKMSAAKSSRRIFVTQKMIEGMPYDIYCQAGDSSKTIAIPAKIIRSCILNETAD